MQVRIQSKLVHSNGGIVLFSFSAKAARSRQPISCHLPAGMNRLGRITLCMAGSPLSHYFLHMSPCSGLERCILTPLIRPAPEVDAESISHRPTALFQTTSFPEESEDGSTNTTTSDEDASVTLPARTTSRPVRRGSCVSVNAPGGGTLSYTRGQPRVPAATTAGSGGDALATRAKIPRTRQTKTPRKGSVDCSEGGGRSANVPAVVGENVTEEPSVDEGEDAAAVEKATTDADGGPPPSPPLVCLSQLEGPHQANEACLPQKINRNGAQDSACNASSVWNRSATPALAADTFSLRARRLAEDREASRARQKLLKSLGVGCKRMGLKTPRGAQRGTGRVLTGYSPDRPVPSVMMS